MKAIFIISVILFFSSCNNNAETTGAEGVDTVKKADTTTHLDTLDANPFGQVSSVRNTISNCDYCALEEYDNDTTAYPPAQGLLFYSASADPSPSDTIFPKAEIIINKEGHFNKLSDRLAYKKRFMIIYDSLSRINDTLPYPKSAPGLYYSGCPDPDPSDVIFYKASKIFYSEIPFKGSNHCIAYDSRFKVIYDSLSVKYGIKTKKKPKPKKSKAVMYQPFSHDV